MNTGLQTMDLQTMEKTVAEYISRHDMLHKGRKSIVALSGGADSVALLLVLRRLGHRVEAAHCNFHLRGAEADRDERFVGDLCSRLDIPLHLAHFDTREYAALHKVSIEMAARDLRYGYFMRLIDDIGAEAVCVAHHREDSVETMLINLVRGTGLHGLCGIKPVNGRVVRPLLCVGRSDIERYLAACGQQYVTDSTNLEADVVRNKIRLNIMPLLRDINPNADMSMAATAERLCEAATVFDKAVDDAVDAVAETHGDGATICVERLQGQTSPESVLYAILRRYGFQPQVIGQVHANLSASTGKMFQSATHDLLFDRGRIIIEPRHCGIKPVSMPMEGLYAIGEGLTVRVEAIDVDPSFRPSRQPMVATIDSAGVSFPLTLRQCDQGDKMVPFGMKGFKLVSDYMTDRKKTLFEKRRQLVVADASGNILWLVGERTDNRFRIGETTTKALVMSIRQS